MVASLVIPLGSASAVIGASSNPPSTAAPDLRTATITNVAQDRVRACFDQPVANFGTAAPSFHLVGYNNVVQADGSSIGADPNPDCVLVDFANSASDITQYTVLTVSPGALQNTTLTNFNVEGAASLQNISLGGGGLPGRTTGPDLTSATKDTVITNDVLFNHDEILDPTSCTTPSMFKLWNNDGTTATGTACSIQPNSTVARVSFTNTTNAVRFFEEDGAVLDRGDDAGGDKDQNPDGSTTGTMTCVAPVFSTAPNCTADLTAVTRVNDTNVDYTFDKGDPAMTSGDCDWTDFYVAEEDTSPYQATACDVRSSSAGSTVVRATFPATLNYSPWETPSASVRETALTGVGPVNTDGALPLGTSREASGFTDAPDLESADFDTSFFRVTFNMDEPVNTGTMNPANFFIFDNNGTKSSWDGSFQNVSGNSVTLGFSSTNINTAVGAGVMVGAVTDYTGSSNVEASVGRGPAPSAGTIQFTASTFSINEQNGTANITVSRTGGTSGPASVNYATSNGSAGPSDYGDVAGTLSWANGEGGTKSFNVPITDDLLAEGTETVNLNLSGASGAALGSPSSATLSIFDNDVSGSLAFNASNYSVGEGAGLATITVVRSGGSSGAVSVNYATSNGSATAGSDYTSTNGTLFFGNGVTSQSFTVPITQDLLVEGNETVNLTLSGAGGGAGIGFPSSSVLTIVDDDVAGAGVISLGSATHTIEEDDGSQTVSVIRTGGTTGTVTVNYATSDGTATAGQDYTAANGTITFLAGETSKTFSVPVLDDSADETSESFNVTLSNPGGGATLGTPAAGAVTIVDNDLPAPGTIDSDLSIVYKPRRNKFSGRVHIPAAPTNEIRDICRNNREVVLHKNNGRARGSDLTGVAGRWKVPHPNPNGGFYAVVKATGLRTLTDGSQVICARAESRVIFP